MDCLISALLKCGGPLNLIKEWLQAVRGEYMEAGKKESYFLSSCCMAFGCEVGLGGPDRQ